MDVPQVRACASGRRSAVADGVRGYVTCLNFLIQRQIFHITESLGLDEPDRTTSTYDQPLDYVC